MRWNPERGLPPERILLIQWRRIGDAVLATPALDAVQSAWPQSRIHLLVAPAAADLFVGDRRVSVVWTRPAPRALPALARDLRRERFDLVVDFQSLTATALLARGSGGTTVGFAKRGRGRLYHRPVRTGAHRGSGYAADHKLDLLRALGLRPRAWMPRLVPPTEPSAAWNALPAGPRVALVPVSLRPHKRWPAAAFAETASRLHARSGAVFVLAGGPGEDAALGETAAGMKHVPHVVWTASRLRELAAFLAGADLYLGNDNGPRHVAIALGVPTLAWFGPRQNPAAWTPAEAPQHRVLADASWHPGLAERRQVVPDDPPAAAAAAAELLTLRVAR
jgi:ADP-heptose:LPS heptosyltransferase